MVSFSTVTIVRAISVRLLFTCHGLVSIWRLYYVTHDTRFWYLGLAMAFLLMETSVTLVKNRGKEWKWFCPSVFIYLVSTVPSIWFLELHEMEKRISTTNNSRGHPLNDSLEDLSAELGNVLGVRFEIRIPILLSPDQWIRTLEQILLLILILGRWILPKGKLTHDQLSQLLLVYIGTAADIVEFFEAFKEEEVRYNKMLCIIILGLWSLSLIQFTLVLTAAKARRDQSGLVTGNENGRRQRHGCCAADVYGILISILLQDLPFLILRLLLIFKYKVLSYTNMFFTSKNSLVIVLLLYRLIVVYIERKNPKPNAIDYREYPQDEFGAPQVLPRSHSVSHNLRQNCGGQFPEDKQYLMKTLPRRNIHNENKPKMYKLRQEKYQWGKDYHFEQVDGRV
ncbi:transmembrane protein 26-like [Argopecten irradians]|uniref:transmembrane protein 26-like n=1 Tax=Argopecten irradians TaxID=31199 RepID=UPI003719C3B8